MPTFRVILQTGRIGAISLATTLPRYPATHIALKWAELRSLGCSNVCLIIYYWVSNQVLWNADRSGFFSTRALGHPMQSVDLLSLRLVGRVGASNYVRSSFSQLVIRMTRTWRKDLSILTPNVPAIKLFLFFPAIVRLWLGVSLSLRCPDVVRCQWVEIELLSAMLALLLWYKCSSTLAAAA